MATVTNRPRLRLRPLATAAMLAGLIVAGGASGIARARAPTPDPSVIVHYEDLDLASAQGTRALYLRITTAARQVCAGTLDMTDPIEVALNRSCQDNAIERAVQAVGSPKLAALHAARSKALPPVRSQHG